MVFLYILAGIGLLVFLILMMKVRIIVTYKKSVSDEGAGYAFAYIGPFRYKEIYPKDGMGEVDLKEFTPEKYREKLSGKTVKKEKTKKERTERDELEDELLPGTLGESLRLVIDLVTRFAGHLKSDIYRIQFTVGADEAATTAYVYVATTSAISFVLELIDQYTVMRVRNEKKISVVTDYDAKSISGDLKIVFSIRIFHILREGFDFIKDLFDTLIMLEEQSSGKQNKHK